jgi:hypothetical protein
MHLLILLHNLMFSASATPAVDDCPKVIRIPAFGTNILRPSLHSAIRIVFVTFAASCIGDSPRIVRVSTFFAVKVHNTFYLFPTPWILSGLRPSRMTAIKFSFSSPYIHSISFADSPNIK